MATLQDITNNIKSKPKLKEMILNRDQKRGDDGGHELEYNIIYKKEDGTINIETARIYVANMGTASETANWIGAAPIFLTGKVAAKFAAALETKLAEIKNEDPLILRLIVIELNEGESCAIVKAYRADAEAAKLVKVKLLFVWADGNILKHTQYEA